MKHMTKNTTDRAAERIETEEAAALRLAAREAARPQPTAKVAGKLLVKRT